MCGIFGIYNYGERNIELLNELIKWINILQHRGKDSCWISFYNKKTKHTEYEKFIGLVKDFKYINKYNNDQINNCIGHVRYSTSGGLNNEDIYSEIQPLVKNNISIAHNGNIPNIKGHDTKHILDKIYIKNVNIHSDIKTSHFIFDPLYSSKTQGTLKVDIVFKNKNISSSTHSTTNKNLRIKLKIQNYGQ